MVGVAPADEADRLCWPWNLHVCFRDVSEVEQVRGQTVHLKCQPDQGRMAIATPWAASAGAT